MCKLYIEIKFTLLALFWYMIRQFLTDKWGVMTLQKSDLFGELYKGDVRVHFSVEFVLARFRHLCFSVFFEFSCTITLKKYQEAMNCSKLLFFHNFHFFAVRVKLRNGIFTNICCCYDASTGMSTISFSSFTLLCF